MTRADKQHTELYKNVFKIVRRLLNYLDPEGLDPGRPGGAPVDEYDMETAPIVAAVINHLKNLENSADIIAAEIDRIWKKSFDRELPGSEAVATEIVREVMKKGIGS